MATFQPLRAKYSLASTPVDPTSSFLRPSRPLVPTSLPAAETVAPSTWEQLERTARFGHSFERVSVLRPATRGPERNKEEQTSTVETMQQVSSTSAPALLKRSASHLAPPVKQASLEQDPQLGHSLERISIFPPEKKNTTGLPDQLKTGIKRLSGLSLDDVHVHYNSAQPAQV